MVRCVAFLPLLLQGALALVSHSEVPLDGASLAAKRSLHGAVDLRVVYLWVAIPALIVCLRRASAHAERDGAPISATPVGEETPIEMADLELGQETEEERETHVEQGLRRLLRAEIRKSNALSQDLESSSRKCRELEDNLRAAQHARQELEGRLAHLGERLAEMERGRALAEDRLGVQGRPLADFGTQSVTTPVAVHFELFSSDEQMDVDGERYDEWHDSVLDDQAEALLIERARPTPTVAANTLPTPPSAPRSPTGAPPSSSGNVETSARERPSEHRRWTTSALHTGPYTPTSSVATLGRAEGAEGAQMMPQQRQPSLQRRQPGQQLEHPEQHPGLFVLQRQLRGFYQDLVRLVTCPVTRAVFRKPVVTSDGHVYEQVVITRLLLDDGFARSPLTRQTLQPSTMFKCGVVEQLVERLRRFGFEVGGILDQELSAIAPPGSDDLDQDFLMPSH